MGIILLLLLIGLPISEIVIFVAVGGRIGVAPTITIVIITAIAGSALLRQQGLVALDRARQSLESGTFPMAIVFDGLCLMFAGALLLTPGFLTDFIGLLLFVPALRRLLQQWASHYFVASGKAHTANRQSSDAWNQNDIVNPVNGHGPVIDGEYHELRQEVLLPGKGERPIDP